MSSYLRPSIDAPVFRDADGKVIDYGNRWGGSPPDETYSVDTHPERFAPLHTVAEALIAYLRDTYDVQLIEGEETAADLLHPAPEVIRAVRIRPNDPACAALTFVFTAYPGIFLHAGLLHDFHYPVCGCDACDSGWASETDQLEQQVLAVVTGHYREGIERGFRPRVEYAFAYPDGGTSGRSRGQDIAAQRLKTAKPILRNLSEGWAAWPHAASDPR
ncbi:MAG: DUF6226 family protein [Candidatus Nanopelagicales bacterium]